MGVFSKPVPKLNKASKERFLRQLRDVVEISNLRWCCGCVEIGNFEGLPTSELKRFQEVVIDFLLHDVSSEQALNIITINNLQHKVMAPILKAVGYKLVSEGVNKGYQGNTVYLYVREINKTRKKR